MSFSEDDWMPEPDLGPRYFNRSGEPISLLEWATLMEPTRNPMAEDYRRVAQTEFETGTWVSTVWIGLNHSWGEGPPLIFETMVFMGRGEDADEYQERYSTEAEALAGHERACEFVKARLAQIERAIGDASRVDRRDVPDGQG